MERPPPPANLGTCSTCSHWYAALREDWVAFQSQGQAIALPVREFIKKGGNVKELSKAKTGPMAPCTWSPQWQSFPPGHWCQQWKDVGMNEKERFKLEPTIVPQPTFEELVEATAALGETEAKNA